MKNPFGQGWTPPGGFEPALAGIRRAGIDFGYLHPGLEGNEHVVIALAKFLGVEPTEKQKGAAIDGFLKGGAAKRAGKPNPNDAVRAKHAGKPRKAAKDPKEVMLRAAQKFGRMHPVDAGEKWVAREAEAMAEKELKRMLTEAEEDFVARETKKAGTEARVQPKALPEHPKAARKRHASEASGLREKHREQLARLRKQHQKAVSALKAKQRKELARR